MIDRRSFFGSAAVGVSAVALGKYQPCQGPVRRVSIDKFDPGEHVFAKLTASGKSVKIWLDGVEQLQCITADVDEGWVKRYQTDHEGNLAVAIADNTILTEIVKGRVAIETVAA